jgi:flagellar protein FlaG
MKTTIASALPIQDPGVYLTPPAPAVDAMTPPAESPRQNADLRLVIEEDEVSGTFVYKTLDRRTGEIVRQFPRDEVVRLKDSANYAPGDVIDSHS